jgi:hypothetical protein
MKGCLLAPFRLFGCLTLILLLLACWLYRDRLDDWGRQLWSRATHKPAVGAVADGAPSAGALASAHRKLAQLRAKHEPVTLTADETASLLGASLGPYMRGTFDSITVRLVPGRIQVRARATTARLPSGLLGPLGLALRDHERVTAEGALSVVAPGRGAWHIDALSFRDFPLPSEILPKLMERVTGDTSRAVPVPLPDQVRTVAVSPEGVTFSPGSP